MTEERRQALAQFGWIWLPKNQSYLNIKLVEEAWPNPSGTVGILMPSGNKYAFEGADAEAILDWFGPTPLIKEEGTQ